MAVLLIGPRIPSQQKGMPVGDATQGSSTTAPEDRSLGSKEAIGSLPVAVSEGLAEIDAALEEGDRDGARRILHEQAVAIGESMGGAALEIALALVERAETLGCLEDQLLLWTQIVEIRADLQPPDHSEYLDAKQYLAITMASTGDLEGARNLFEELLQARTQLLPPDHPNLIGAKENVACVVYSLGDLYRARKLFEEVLEVRERLLPRDDPDLLGTKNNLAATRSRLGDLQGARALQEEVLEIRMRALPYDDPGVLMAKANLANTLYRLGDLQRARSLQEEVLETRLRLFSPVHLDVLAAKEGLAITMSSLGDLRAARVLREEVLEARTHLLPPGHPRLFAAKENLASSMYALGELEEAGALFEEVLEARARLLSPDDPYLLNTKNNVAATRSRLGDQEGARALQRDVLEARTRIFPADHPGVLSARGNLARTEYALGDFEGARELFTEMLEVAACLLPPDHALVLATKRDLATTRRSLGDVDGARALTEDVLEEICQRAPCLRGESRRAAREMARFEIEQFLKPAISSSFGAEGQECLGAFASLETLRMVSDSRWMDVQAIVRRPDLEALRASASRCRAELNDLVSAAPDHPEDVEAWRQKVQDATQERDRYERAFFSELTSVGAVVDVIEPRDVSNRFSERECAISFFRYPKNSVGREASPTVDSFLAFLVLHDGSVQRVELGAAAEIEELVHAWRAQLGTPIGHGVSSELGDNGELEAGVALRERILDPVLARLGEEQPAALYVVLDDVLHLAPLDALPLDAQTRVGDRTRILQEVSFERLCAGPPATLSPGTFLALGGIGFDSVQEAEEGGDANGASSPGSIATIGHGATPPASERGGGPVHFEELLETRLEIEAVGELFKERFGMEPVLLEGKRATKEALAARAGDARWLHVATHGWFAPDLFRSQLDELADTRHRYLFEKADATLRGFAPETLCGLALAGANLGRDAMGHVPGILTAEELATLDLGRCELAVLSACETNVGIRRAGQGIQSLQTALYAAGARSSITSLWKVDDEATREFFGIFYANLWEKGMGKAEALWEAKAEMRDRRHPTKDWAGWVFTGDPD